MKGRRNKGKSAKKEGRIRKNYLRSGDIKKSDGKGG